MDKWKSTALEGRDLSVLLTMAPLDTAPDMQQAKWDYIGSATASETSTCIKGPATSAGVAAEY